MNAGMASRIARFQSNRCVYLPKPDILYMRIKVFLKFALLTKNVVIACMFLTMCLLFTVFTAFT